MAGLVEFWIFQRYLDIVNDSILQSHDHLMLHKFQPDDTILVPSNLMEPLNVLEVIGLDSRHRHLD